MGGTADLDQVCAFRYRRSKLAAAKPTIFPPSALAMSSDIVPKDWDMVIFHGHPEPVLWALLPFYYGICAISYCSPATTKHMSVWADQLECFPSPAPSPPFVNSMQHLSLKVFNKYIKSGLYSTWHWRSQHDEMWHPQHAGTTVSYSWSDTNSQDHLEEATSSLLLWVFPAVRYV